MSSPSALTSTAPTLPIANAVQKIHVIHQTLGYRGQVAWSLLINNLPPTTENEKDKDVLAGADVCPGYLAFWLEGSELETQHVSLPEGRWDLSDGVYFVSLDFQEDSLAFVLIIQGDHLHYAGGYGGQGLFSFARFKKVLWFGCFHETLESGNLTLYEYVFALAIKPVPKTLTFEKIAVKKSKKYA